MEKLNGKRNFSPGNLPGSRADENSRVGGKTSPENKSSHFNVFHGKKRGQVDFGHLGRLLCSSFFIY